MRKMPRWLEKRKKFAASESRVTFWRKCGSYIIVHEEVSNKSYGGTGHTLIRSAYSPSGLYIGSTRTAWRLWHKYDINRFYGNSSTAFVGVNDQGIWYGWSHRAISKFKKGQWKRKDHLPHEGRAYRIVDPRKTAFAFAEEVS